MRQLLATITVALMVALMCCSCGESAWFDEVASVNEQGWSPADSVDFTITVSDTTALYSLLIEVRNSIDYPYSNLFLMVNTTFPDGSMARDTIECPMADHEGHWLGRRSGRYVDGRYRLRAAYINFPMSGQYTFSITNGMRDSAIKGIRSIGLRIEEQKQ